MTDHPIETDQQAALRRDFRKLVYLVWQHLGLPRPTDLQYDLCRYLQSGPKRIVIEGFRGVGKSWITAAFVCWLGLRDPNVRVLVVSASKQLADQFSTFVLRLIQEIPALQHLQPKDDQRNSKIAFDFGPSAPALAPSVKSVGITGQITGSRADVIIADDVEVPNNSATQAMRDKLSESIKEFDAVLTAKKDSRVIYLGTPQTEQSIYNLLEARGYEIRVWPAEVPDQKQRVEYGARLAPYVQKLIDQGVPAGTPTDPKRFGVEDLIERKASYGRSGYALQFMLSTKLSDMDRYPLKLRDLIVMSLNTERGPAKVDWGNSDELRLKDIATVGFNGDYLYKPVWIERDPLGNPMYTEYTGSVLAIDPSGRGKDETGYAVVKILHGKLFLLAAGGYRDGSSPETLQALAYVAKQHKVNLIVVEANFGDGMYAQLLKPVLAKTYPCTVEEVKHSQQKEKRICDTLEPVIANHKLVVDQKLFEHDMKSTEHLPMEEGMKYQLFYQLTRITRDRGALVRDDRLDALAIAVAYWVEQMSRDEHAALEDHRQRLLDKELERFMDHVLGPKNSPSMVWSSRDRVGTTMGRHPHR